MSAVNNSRAAWSRGPLAEVRGASKGDDPMKKPAISLGAAALAASCALTAFAADSREAGSASATPRNPASAIANPAGTTPSNPASTIANPVGMMPRNPASIVADPAGTIADNPASTVANPRGAVPSNPASTVVNPQGTTFRSKQKRKRGPEPGGETAHRSQAPRP